MKCEKRKEVAQSILLMKQRFLLGVAMVGIATVSLGAAPERYDEFALKHAERVLEIGLDRYGQVHSNLWASVIDTEAGEVPVGGVDPMPGVREYDMAVGGANLYHELDTIRLMNGLATLKNNPRFSVAVQAYLRDSFELTQNVETGLLGWGEHLYYNFFLDEVMPGPAQPTVRKPHYYEEMAHEFLERTPPWSVLWENDNQRTRRAIDGIIYHYNGPDPKTYLFNRHAHWHIAEHRTKLMPWIKHAALYSYSWAYLYAKTGDERYRNWSHDAAALHFNLRSRDTGLLFGTILHHRIGVGKDAPASGAAFYGYWLERAYRESGDERLLEMGLSTVNSYLEYAYENGGRIWSGLELDGTPTEGSNYLSGWSEGYGSLTLSGLGSVLVALSEYEGALNYESVAVELFERLIGEEVPARFNALQVGEAIGFCLDLYDTTEGNRYLEKAQEFADLGTKSLWNNGMFVRQVGDRYYESKLGSSTLALALLRLQLTLDGNTEMLESMEWGR